MMSYRPNFILVDRRPASTTSHPAAFPPSFPQAFRFVVPEHVAGKPVDGKPRPKPAK